MRTMLIGMLLLLAACNQSQPQQQTVAEGCGRNATHAVTWSNDAAPDLVIASSDGPSCAQAIVTLAFRDAQGEPLWVFASTYYDMSVGGRNPDAPPVSDQEMEGFLNSWADVSAGHSGDLPAWREGAGTLGEAVDGMAYGTAFDRETYESLRARNLPQVCFAAAAEASHCLVIDPMSHAPTLIVMFGA